MNLLTENLRQWTQALLPAMPLFAGRKRPGVRWTARNGAQITMRVVRHPADEPARESDAVKIQAFVRGLSLKTRFHRFFSPLHELTPAQLERSLQSDPAREMTLLATVEARGEEIVIGMAQYFVTGADRAEFAVVVADEWQGQGVGKSTLFALSWIARAAGIVWFDGDVLLENAAMRGMLEKAGYMFRTSPEDDNAIRATRRLNRPAVRCARLENFLRQVGAWQLHSSPQFV